MGFGQSIRACFSKYVTFSGRASRPEYWYFFLFVFLGGLVTTVIEAQLFPGSVALTSETSDTGAQRYAATNSGPVSMLFGLATFLPLLAAGWRRMHDSGRSGLHLVYPLIVMIGVGTFAAFGMGVAQNFGEAGTAISAITAIILFIALGVLIISPLLVLWWLARPTQPSPNKYGPYPRGVAA